VNTQEGPQKTSSSSSTPLKEGYVILDLDIIADDYPAGYVDILAQDTVFPNPGAFHHMAKMPDFLSRFQSHMAHPHRNWDE